MKKILSLCAMLGLAVNCFGTGSFPLNTPQTGFVNFTTNGSAFIVSTNLFEPPFTYPPAMTFWLSSGATNALPFTNSILTATNFAISINTPTNATIQWTAYPAACMVQFGSQTNMAGISTNVTFVTPYAFPPVVVLTPVTTNVTAVAAVTAVTTTNFTILCNLQTTNYWQAVGETYPGNAGTQTVTH